ncbi:MAG: low molecular weight phosphatase family protein [Nanoarchaeota archaeon]
MNILFICRYNKFRSKLAEAFLNKHSDQHTAKSAGIIRGSPVDDPIIRCGLRNGVNVGGVSKGVDVPLLRWQDMIVIVADDVPEALFEDNETVYGKRLMHWMIPDVKNGDPAEMDKTAQSIEKKVLDLLNDIAS